MHVVIVGGGVVGTAAAATLAEHPVTDVTLLERDDLGGGTTAASAAVFTTQQTLPRRVDHRLRQRAWETYEPAVERGELSYERVGLLTVAESEGYAVDCRDAVDTLRRFGYDAEWVDAAEFDRFDLAGESAVGGLYTPEEGYFDTDELVAFFAERARERGATVRAGEGVTGLRTADGVVSAVETENGLLRADAVVNAAGPWATRVNEFVGVEAPMRHTVGPILAVEGAAHDLPFTIFESKHYVRPAGEAGAYVGAYRTDYADGERLDPDEPRAVDEAFRGAADALLDESVPPLRDATVEDEWVGLRTVTPDGRPLVGETEVDGFYLAAGMSGLGVTLAPAVADVLDAAVHGEESALLDVVRPDRF
ncbi:NAD(P)/FAD-dependent oxidoreductase [Halospeciosus flavus]|uniref:NAD(P)/FAD-dependent oxidoreductase n=1 Tax=Halospeciosus flavus TaxID=3032283 RepID=A0ABD5Z4G7_9EURY|nr:FAD-dependent oxidoreductase [Halospeciosus flavus]